ncbi:hypothetical protein LTR97_012119 [Elasticomyces elasticus]|uniref:Uncharacterized protein n=1 Tax=Elasticomyces elasticus TaxID=574655 RepID=A0AAN7VL18_9PEZI|nr:hypothetical protein LTR97_012119 [Elasticomyces elasticus]
MALDPPNIPQTSDAQPASNIPPIAMVSQPSPANAKPAFNPQSISTAPPLQSSQPLQQFAPPFDLRLFPKPYQSASGHWSRLKQPLASLSAVGNAQPALNPSSDAMALRSPSADAEPDANQLLTAMTSPPLDIRPTSNMPPSIAMAPPPQPVYLLLRQLPVNSYPLRDPQYRLTHMTYFDPPANRNRQPASNALRTAVASQPPSAIDGRPPSNISRTATAPQPLFAIDEQPASNASRAAVAPQPSSANDHSDSKHSPGTAAPSARTTQPPTGPHPISNAQPATNNPSAPMAPSSQLAQLVVKSEPVSDAQQAAATSLMPKAPDSQPAQPASNSAPATMPPADPTQPDEYPHPLKNAAQYYLEKPPTNTTDRIIMRELRAVYDSLSYAHMNTLRTKFLATLPTQGKLKNERLRLTFDESDDPRSNPVHLAAEKVKHRVESGEKNKTAGGMVVSQPNGMPMGSGQQAGMIGGPQLGNATNGGGGMSSYRSNVPVGSGQYYGAVNGQQLGQVSNSVGMMPAQPSNIPLSSGQYSGPASGPQPGNDINPGDWLLAQASNVPVSSGQHLGGVNSQQSGIAFNDVAGSSTDYHMIQDGTVMHL